MRVLSSIMMTLVVSVIIGSIANYTIAEDAKEPIKCKCEKIQFLIKETEQKLASIEKRIDKLTSEIAAITPSNKKEKAILKDLIDRRKRLLDNRSDVHKSLNDLEKDLRECIKNCPDHK